VAALPRSITAGAQLLIAGTHPKQNVQVAKL
jgi:hypothetical protein